MNNNGTNPPQHQPAQPDEAAFAAKLRESLRASERSLGSATAARLRQARARAVAEMAKPAVLHWPSGWVGAAAAPVVCAAAFAGWIALGPVHQVTAPTTPTARQSAQIEMLELLGSEDAPLTDDDVDFVRWLDEAHGDS